jgi:hypothetical protein
MQNLIETWQPVRVLKLFTYSVFQAVSTVILTDGLSIGAPSK